MAFKPKQYILNFSIEDVFTKLTNVIMLDFSKKADTLNTSFTQPIGTVFKYHEHRFGRNALLTMKIEDYQKPHILAYSVKEQTNAILVRWLVEKKGTQTVVTQIIIPQTEGLFHRFVARSLARTTKKKSEQYINFIKKTLK